MKTLKTEIMVPQFQNQTQVTVTFQQHFEEPNRLPNRQRWLQFFHARSIEKYASKAMNSSSQASNVNRLQVSDLRNPQTLALHGRPRRLLREEPRSRRLKPNLLTPW